MKRSEKEYDTHFGSEVNDRLHKMFLEEYGRDPNSEEEQMDFVKKHIDVVCREIIYEEETDILTTHTELDRLGIAPDLPEENAAWLRATRKRHTN